MEKIAIIGIGCLIPGGNTPEAFYESLLNHGEYLDQDIIYDIDVKALKADVDEKAMDALDISFKYTLYIVHEALKDSGYLGNTAVLGKAGIILGNREPINQKAFDLFKPIYLREIERHLRVLLHRPDFRFDEPDDSGNTSPLNMFHFSYPTLFAAQALSMKGPAYAIDAACAASLYTTKMAMYYLLSGQMDLMVAGGLFTGKYNTGFPYYMKKLGVTPQQAKSRPLDKNSGGMVVHEGGGAVVLKRLSDAVRDKDTIHAVIDRCGWSNDGTGKFFLSPSKDGQVIAYRNTFGNEAPDGIDYIECHATGTQVGDGVELSSLEEFYGKRPQVPMIGAVKGNIGHLLTGAGAAAMIKVIMAMKRGAIPATINVTDPLSSPEGTFSGKNMILANTPWPQKGAVKRAAISAFGFGGINSHLVLREYVPGEIEDKAGTGGPFIPPAQVAITGIGLHFGNLENVKQFNDALFYGRQPKLQENPPRLRGMDQNRTALQPFHMPEDFPAGFYLSPFTFDYLNHKVHPKEDHEIIDKEMLILKVTGLALMDAGIETGPPQNIATVLCAKQNLAQLSFYLSSDIPAFIQRALAATGLSLESAEIKDLIKICRRACDPKENDFDRISTGIGPIGATRIAALWNFCGPTFKMSSMDNSFLRGIEFGKFLLESGDVEAVLVGALDDDPILENALWHYRHGKEYGMDPRGVVFSEGAAAVVLRKSGAMTSRGKVYAHIDDIAIRRADAPFSPCPSFPEMAVRFQQRHPGDQERQGTPGYIEFYGHAVKTPLLSETLRKLADIMPGCDRDETVVGFAADHFGHNNMTAQAASVIKAALMLHYSYKPPTPKKARQEREAFETSSLKPAESSLYWQRTGRTRTVSVMGTAHNGESGCIRLSEADVAIRNSADETPALNPPLILIANKDAAGFLEELAALKEAVGKDPSLTNLALTYGQLFMAQKGPDRPYTLAILGETKEKLLQEIEEATSSIKMAFETGQEWQGTNGSCFTSAPYGEQAKCAVIYPPSGLNSDKALYELTTTFPQLVDVYDAFVKHHAHRKHKHITRFNEYLKSKEQLPLYMDAILAHLATRLVMDVLTVHPDMILGCSFGELLMYITTGVLQERGDADLINDIVAPLIAKLSDRDFIRRYFRDDSAEWVTYYCKGSRKGIEALLSALKETDKAFLTIRASAENVMISGLQTECERIFKKTKCFAYQISRNIFVHTPPALAFHGEIIDRTIKHPISFNCERSATYYSTSDCRPVNFEKKRFATNMANCICKSIDFEAVINKAYEDGARIFISMDSSDLCTEWIANTLDGRDALILPIKQSNISLEQSVHRLTARLLAHGFPLDIDKLIRYPHSRQAAKGLVQTIAHHPRPIGELILTPENREKFSRLAPQTTQAPEVSHPIPERRDDTPPAKMPETMSMNPPPAPISALPPPFTLQELQRRIEENTKIHQVFLDVQNGLNGLLYDRILAQYGTFPESRKTAGPSVPAGISQPQSQRQIVWNEAQILEMTAGKMSNVLGSRYSRIDAYPVRARLPLPPFMFVSRVMGIQAEFGQLKPSRLEIEYDIPEDAWYLNNGRVPFSIMTESSHCGILLMSYIGVDEIFKGELRFRALNSATTICSEKMLTAGETCRGIFQITSFATFKDNTLAFYTYELFDGEGTRLFIMKGAGGFFSEKDLQNAMGYPDAPGSSGDKAAKVNFKPFLSCEKQSFSAGDISNLQQGRNDLCFGRGYVPYDNQSQLYPEKFQILNRVPQVDVHGGPYGLGLVIGEADIDPAHWIFGAHFKNDPVLPAVFSIEGGIQLLSFYVHYIGLKDIAGANSYQNTLLGTESKALFRGEVRKEATTLRYECVIKNITLKPEITIAADIKVFKGDRLIVVVSDMGMKMISREGQNEAFMVA